jgi:hypothetical protein
MLFHGYITILPLKPLDVLVVSDASTAPLARHVLLAASPRCRNAVIELGGRRLAVDLA